MFNSIITYAKGFLNYIIQKLKFKIIYLIKFYAIAKRYLRPNFNKVYIYKSL